MAHYVICLYCKNQFDRDKEKDWVKIGRRYAHCKCAAEHEQSMTQEERDYEELLTYCKELFKDDYNYIVTKRFIEKYKKENDFTYSGIKRSLQYFYEIKGNSIDKANGSIGIVPYIYREAYNYFYNLYLAQQRNKDYKKGNTQIKEVTIASPRQRIKIKKMWFDDDEDRIGEINI